MTRLLFFCALLSCSVAAEATTYTVTSISDSGAGSLREAITLANANSGADVIDFNIAGAAPYTISLLSLLPAVSGQTVIDATTQPGYSVGAPVVEIDCNDVAYGIEVTASNCTIRGFVITDCHSGGIFLRGNNNVVQSCFLGTDITGSVSATSSVTGTGILIHGSGNVVGGTTPQERNIISGNPYFGVIINSAGGINNVVIGNYIGTNPQGTAAVPNATGFYIGQSTHDNRIGGSQPGEGNLISGNSYSGVHLFFGSLGCTIQGNTIGPDVTGTSQLGTSVHGIDGETAHNVVIGGVNPGEGNHIAGAVMNVFAGGGTNSPSTNWSIYGNRIGTDASGTGPLNTTDASANGTGVRVTIGSHDIRVGGTAPGMGNIIAYHKTRGVLLSDQEYNVSILGNSIHHNTELGIDLGNYGPTANDTGDADTGANGRQNYPLIETVVTTNSKTLVFGWLNSTPNSTFRIELFSNTTCGGLGYGEGETFIGTMDLTTDSLGNGRLWKVLPVGPVSHVSATATDSLGNTSEFAPCFLAEPGVLSAARDWNLYE